MLLRILAILAVAPVLAVGAEYPFSYSRVQVADGIYAFVEPFGNAVVSGNTMVVIGEDAVAVVDTGHHPRLTRRMVEEIRALTPKPVQYVVNTHWHNDHVAGNGVYAEAFPGAKVIAHTFTADLLERETRPFQGPNCVPFLREQSKPLREMLASGIGSDGKAIPEARRKRLTAFVADADAAIEDCADFRFRGADIAFEDQVTLRLGKREVKLLHLGRANTAGDIVAWVPDARVLAAGDLVVHPFPFATHSYMSEWAAAMRKLQALPFEVLVPGHGPVMRDRAYLETLTAMFESMMAQARAAWRPGMTVEELRKAIDLKEFRQRIARDDPMIGANFDFMVAGSAVTRAWQELGGRFEPEALQRYEAQAAFAPTPYTAQQIREATREGRTYEFLVERPDAPPARRRMVFRSVTPAGATVERAMLDDKGAISGEPTRTETTWEEMRDHTKYPQGATTIETATLTTPAGTFACRRYTIVEAGDGRTVAWFANELPGPPVQLRKEVAGKWVMTMTLLSHRP